MQDILDLERYPLDRLDSPAGQRMVARARADLAADGLFNLPGLVRPGVCARTAGELAPRFATQAFHHARRHNVYFQPDVPGLPPCHPALAEFETENHTLCADQIPDAVVARLYAYPPLAEFLARVMGKAALYPMDDPLARLNVMQYRTGEALNWHFDRAEFTTTLLLQAPEGGGVFEYARDLRGPGGPNHDAVGDLLAGRRTPARLVMTPGTLNVFCGLNTAHRVTPVEGPVPRMVAVFSYYEVPGVAFSDAERIGFYGRAS